MSKSIRKHPFVAIAGNRVSEKKDKQLANRRLRRINKLRILTDKEPVVIKEISDVWEWSKDGKKRVLKGHPCLRK